MMKGKITELALVFAVLAFLLTLIGGLILQAYHRTSSGDSVKKSCIASGQSWVYDKNYNGQCVPQEVAARLAN